MCAGHMRRPNIPAITIVIVIHIKKFREYAAILICKQKLQITDLLAHVFASFASKHRRVFKVSYDTDRAIFCLQTKR